MTERHAVRLRQPRLLLHFAATANTALHVHVYWVLLTVGTPTALLLFVNTDYGAIIRAVNSLKLQ